MTHKLNESLDNWFKFTMSATDILVFLKAAFPSFMLEQLIRSRMVSIFLFFEHIHLPKQLSGAVAPEWTWSDSRRTSTAMQLQQNIFIFKAYQVELQFWNHSTWLSYRSVFSQSEKWKMKKIHQHPQKKPYQKRHLPHGHTNVK